MIKEIKPKWHGYIKTSRSDIPVFKWVLYPKDVVCDSKITFNSKNDAQMMHK